MARRSAYKERQGFRKTLLKFLKQENPIKYAIYRARWRLAPRFKYVTKFPTHLDIENTNTCNLRCVMCPHGNPTAEFKKSLGFMDFEFYKRIIDEGVKKGLCSIKLNWRGEPLMHPKLPQMIRYAKAKGVLEVLINTNGQLLTKEKSRQLIDAKLDYIIFSFDAFNKKTYEKIRVGADFEKGIKNIENFIRIRNSKKRKKPLIRMQMVKMDSNKHEIDDYIKYWEPKVDLLSTQDYTSRGEGENKLKTQEEYDGRLACPQLWQRMIITWDGKVIMCCRDWESENIIGDLKKQTIEEVWRGRKLKSIRDIHKKRDLDKIPVCEKCTFKETFDWR